MLNVAMLSAFMLYVVMLSVIMLSLVMPYVVLLGDIMLSVVIAEYHYAECCYC